MKERNAYGTVQILIFFNLLLALIAFFKDVLLAGYFGTSKVADAINLAFFIPDTVGNNLIGTAIAVSSIPVLTQLSIGKESAFYHLTLQRIAAVVFGGTLLVLGGLLLLANPLFHLFHLSGGEDSWKVLNLYYMMSPIIVAAPCWLLGSAILQASKRFLLPAITPVLYNLFILFCIVICQWSGISQTKGEVVFSIGLTAGTAIVGVLTWAYIFREQKVVWRFKDFFLKIDSPEIKKLSSAFTSYLFILLFSQAVLLSERVFASTLETGTIAALSYAYRISQFPIWVFIAAINTFILPTISAHVVKNDRSSLKKDLFRSFTFVILVSAFLSMLLVIFSEPLLQLVLARGSFNSQSVELTSRILKGYGLSIVGQSLYVFCTRYYVAEGKLKVPFIIGLFGSLLNIILLKIFIPVEGASGIGYAAAMASTFNGVTILVYFIKNLIAVEQKRGITYE
ncbi:hypothetical protein HPT25_11390 [Bacillus sp. BRMEA1]|uniref:murein biosynthesis integral membrane protein MurJ n=1 Tax=Neobacillus endophyticus TaxID=2738405 RepID=UPI0015659C13|nr:lipid II flippase MurJ [Neobacillus endophyticus]NRD77988.1 hypothetical protein [Neobacillus endophyticus]